jgi:ribosomal protein S18 acetylase RimI-like enzyme
MTSGARTSSITIRRAAPADAARLAAFAGAAFVDTFGADNRPEDMRAYLAESFGEPVQRRELEDPEVTVLLAESGNELMGYAMLRDGDVAAPVDGSSAIEIARLYAGKRWIGAGVGALLMRSCLTEAQSRDKETIWLGVWERNARAIAFYRRWGFADVGSQSFQLGGDLQSDRVMARRVADG